GPSDALFSGETRGRAGAGGGQSHRSDLGVAEAKRVRRSVSSELYADGAGALCRANRVAWVSRSRAGLRTVLNACPQRILDRSRCTGQELHRCVGARNRKMAQAFARART